MELEREGNGQEGAWHSELSADTLQRAKLQMCSRKD